MSLRTSSATRSGHSEGRKYDLKLDRSGETCIPAIGRSMTLVELCKAEKRCNDTLGCRLGQVDNDLPQEDILRERIECLKAPREGAYADVGNSFQSTRSSWRLVS